MSRRGGAVTLVVAGALVACSGLPDAQAIAVVRRYNERVAEAYRIGDPRIVDEVCGDAEARRLAGFIGVKADLGHTLDAELLELVPAGVERERGGDVLVRTRERWYYRDRRIGSGEQVGEDSSDAYALQYRLGRREGRWVVTEVTFLEPPDVGRRRANATGSARDFHGTVAPAPAAADATR